MPLSYELGESLKIGIPLGRMADVTTASMDGITPLPAQLIGIQGSLGLVLEEMVAEVRIVHRGSAETVDTDDDEIGLNPFSPPRAVAEGI